MRAAHALKWSFFAEAASRLIAPLQLLVLARLLTPADFGVVAAATVLISFSQAIADGGLGKALIQRQTKLETNANVVFWLTLVFGIGLTGILFVVAPWVASFFNDGRITAVVRVLSLQVFLAAAATTPNALLQRQMAFRDLFTVRLLTAGIPAVISIPLALEGMGYWALVLATLAGQLFQTLVLWAKTPWRPRAAFDLIAAYDLLAFARWTALSALLVWCYGWADTIVVGRYFGSHDMGLYRTGTTLVAVAFGLFFSPLLPVAYSAFSRSQHDVPLLVLHLREIVRNIAVISFPIGCFFIAFSDEIGRFALGPKWNGVDMVLMYMAAMQAFAWLICANGELYRAINKPHVETWVNLVALPVYIAVYIASARFGLEPFLQARVGLALLTLGAHLLVARKVLGTTAMSGTVGVAMLSSCFGLLAAKLVPASVVGAMGVYCLVVLLCLFAFERPLIERSLSRLTTRGQPL